MTIRARIAVTLFLTLFVLSEIGYAQGTTGAVEGIISDPNGQPIAGATVTILSRADVTAVERSATTNSKGFFAFRELPPGTYIVTAESTNFRKAADEIAVTVDKTSVMDVFLSVGGGSSVVVIEPQIRSDGPTPEGRTNNKAEVLEKLPSRPTFGSLLKIAPFVRPEPLAGGFQIDGASGADNTFYIDGQEVTNFKSGTLEPNYDLPFELLQEVQVKSDAITAEYPGSLGGAVTLVTRGGNNEWRGNFGVSFSPAAFQGKPNAVLSRFGTTTGQIEYFQPRKDSGAAWFPAATFSGPIVKEKLWFFAGYVPEIYEAKRSIDYFTATNPATRTIRESIDYRADERVEQMFVRLDAQPFQNVRATASFLYNPVIQNGLLPSAAEGLGGAPQSALGLRGAAFLATLGGRQNSNLVNGQISWDVTRNLNLNFRAGRGFLNEKLGSYGVPAVTRFICNAGGTPQNVPGSNCSPGFQNVANNSVRNFEVSERTTFDAEAALSGIHALGRHNFKFGYQYNQVFNDVRDGYVNTGIVQLFYGVPISTLIGLNPTPGNLGSGFLQRFGTIGSDRSATNALYAQDSWTISDRLYIHAGIRFENERLADYGDAIMPDFGWKDKIAPRVGVTYDVAGNGKSRIFGSYGWYYDRLKSNFAQGSFGEIFYRDYFEIFSSRGAAYTNYTRANILGSNVDNRNGNCPIINSTGWSVCQFGFTIPTNIPVLPDITPVVHPNLKPARTSQFSAGFEQRLATNVLISAIYLHRNLDRAIEDIGFFNSQGSENYTLANPGTSLICDIVVAANQPCAKAERKYDAFELRFDTRQSDYFLSASYTYSRLFGNYSGLASSDEFGRVSPNVTRTFDFPSSGFTADGDPDNGRLATDRPHVFKAFGGYSFRWFGRESNKTSVSAFTTIQSGTPLTTIYTLYSAPNSILNGRGDLGRTEFFSETDLRLGHRYKFGRDQRYVFEPFIDVLNLFDERNELARQTSVSSTAFTASVLRQAGCLTCLSQITVYDSIFNGSGIRQAVQNILTTRGVSATGTRNDFNQPNFFQSPRSVRFGARFFF